MSVLRQEFAKAPTDARLIVDDQHVTHGNPLATQQSGWASVCVFVSRKAGATIGLESWRGPSGEVAFNSDIVKTVSSPILAHETSPPCSAATVLASARPNPT